MRIAPATFVSTHAKRPLRDAEVVLRYGAAYGCMLVALAAAQLVSSNAFVLVLVGITLVGLPLSLTLRRLMESSARWRSYRFLINSTIVMGSFISSILYLLMSHPELFTRGFLKVLVVDYGVADSLQLLMELFLIFSTFRAVAIINDKEAVLSAVPSFSALLLLMVIHRGPQVVLYYLMWAVFAAILFALDHRAEAAKAVHGRISAMVPGQEVRLSARSLATVLSFSLVIAMGIAFILSSRNPDDRSQLERWMMGMASGATRLALSLPDISVNNGPERQIDYTSGPALPTRTELWRVVAVTFNRQLIHPQYWRMFTLVKYNGKSWSQASGNGTQVNATYLDARQWPLLPDNGYFTFMPRRHNFPFHTWKGYDIESSGQDGRDILHHFGSNQHLVRVVVESRASNIGFVPALPAVKTLRIRDDNKWSPIWVRRDGSVDTGVLNPGQQALMLASVPGDIQYGMTGSPPLEINKKPHPSVELSPAEREMDLQLPANLRQPSSRLLKFARKVLQNADPNASDYSKGKRLAAAVESRGVYTLRPPAIPEGADAAEYFLMDNPRGYCTYFAGALTVLCRLSGIPARVVSGFVNPEWDSNTGAGILREANAHAWTEIWVPNWGWAPLDATPPDDRGDNAMGLWENWNDFAHNAVAVSREWLRTRWWLLALPLLLLASIAVMTLKKIGLPLFLQRLLAPWRSEHYRNNPHLASRAVMQSYRSMARRMSRRFRPRTRWETHQEWLDAAISGMHLESPQPFQELTALYERARYAPPLVEAESAVRALALLRALSWKRVRQNKNARNA